MKYIVIFTILFLVSWVQSGISQISDKDIFQLMYSSEFTEEPIAFVSLSPFYISTLELEANALPENNGEGMNSEGIPMQRNYIPLEGQYRKQLLEASGLKESQNLYIYDYTVNALLSLPVKELKASAWLNMYRTPEVALEDPFDYFFGLEIPESKMKEVFGERTPYLAAFGHKSPFATEGLRPIVWTKCAPENCPVSDADMLETSEGRYEPADAYLYDTGKETIYVREFYNMEMRHARGIAVMRNKNKEIILEASFYASESGELNALNVVDNADNLYQYYGKLFQDQPEVILGFYLSYYSCEKLYILRKGTEPIETICDNRN